MIAGTTLFIGLHLGESDNGGTRNKGGIEMGKKVLEGWIGRHLISEPEGDWWNDLWDFANPNIWRGKADGYNWPANYLPMVGVKVTVEWEDSDLPALHSLRGCAPNLTGSLSTEEFLDKIRDSDERGD